MKLKLKANQAQSNWDLNSAKMNFVPNLELLTSIGGNLKHGQAQNGVNFYV